MSHSHDQPTMVNPPHRHHDMGATEHPPFELDEHEPSDVDKRVDALVNLLADPKIQCVRPDERRRGIEELDEETYHSFTYYQRWLVGVTNVLIEKGVFGRDELADQLTKLGAPSSAGEGDACGT